MGAGLLKFFRTSGPKHDELGLNDFAGSDAGSAYLHGLHSAVNTRADALNIRKEATLVNTRGVQANTALFLWHTTANNAVARSGSLATN